MLWIYRLIHNSFSLYSTLIPQAHFTLHQAPVPPTCSLCRLTFTSALASIPFHPLPPFLLSLNVFVQIWNRDEGHFVQGLFLFGDRLLISRLPPHLLDFPLLLHLLLGLGKLGIWVSQAPLNLVLSSLVLFFKILLPSAYLPCDPSLPISVSPLLSLCFSLSLKSSTPESPKTPSSPWDLEWMTAQLTRPFAPFHSRTWTQPSLSEEPFSWSALLTADPYSEQQLNTFTHAHRRIIEKCKTVAAVFCWAIFRCSLNED